MFVQNLNSEQQAVLLFLAKKVAEADHSLDKYQLDMVDILSQQANDNVTEHSISLEELPNLFQSEKAKLSLLLELLGIAHANNEYHLNEKDLITQYAKALKVSQEKLEQLENWVEKQLQLSQEINELLSQ